MAFYDYIPGKQLDPSALSAYCDEVVQYMDNQSCAYVLLSNDVSNFCNDTSMQANSIDGFKLQMQGYTTALGGLCVANELDKQDFNTLKELLSTISENKLYGTEIVNSINEAIRDYNVACSNIDYWNNCIKEAEEHPILNHVFIQMCKHTVRRYQKEAEDALEDKKTWEGRARKLIAFEAAVLGLFASGRITRETAQRGLEQISTAFSADTGAYGFTDYTWMGELTDISGGSVIDSSGTINWDMVNQILAKDGDTISDLEYQMVAYVYVNANVSDLNGFYEKCGSVEAINWEQLSKFNPDYSKFKGIMDQTYKLEESLLLQEITGDYTAEELNNIESMRNQAIQRYLLMNQFVNSPIPYRNGSGNYFEIRESELADGVSCIELTMANKISGSGRSVNVATTTTKISEPISDGEFLEDFCRNYSFDKLSGTVSTTTQIVMNNATDTVVSTVRDKAAEAVLKSAIKNGAECVPFVGFGIGILSDISEANEQRTSIDNASNLNNVADLAADFGCTGVVIEKDDSYTLSIFAGKETEARMTIYTSNTQVDVSNLFLAPGQTAESIYSHECQYRNEVDSYSDVYVTPGYHLYK